MPADPTDWRQRFQAADDLLCDIADACRGKMPTEAREGGPDRHRAAWEAVRALRAALTAALARAVEAERERDEARAALAAIVARDTEPEIVDRMDPCALDGMDAEDAWRAGYDAADHACADIARAGFIGGDLS